MESEPDLDITIKHNNLVLNASEISDGLSGELYSDDGWISQFSQYGLIEP